MRSPIANIPQVRFDTIQCGGGWDQVTPTLSLKNGVLRDTINFQCNSAGGYEKIKGYERYDGRPAPSAAAYASIYFSPILNIPVVGDSISNGTSTGVIAAVYNNHIAVTKTTGTFSAGDTITDTTLAVTVGTAVNGSITSPEEDAISQVAAANIYRADIQKVPGTGNVLGGFLYQDVVYAFRATVADSTKAALYKSTSSGWSLVPFFYEVSFTAASVAPAESTTLTQGGVTATVKRVVLQSGAYNGGTAAGRMIISAAAGGHFGAGAFTGGMTGTCSGIETVITMLSGGKVDTVDGNFTGSASTKRIYACDGINRAFEFDGTTLVPIVTGSSPDIPKHIVVHKQHLILAIGSSAIISSPGLPYDYTALNGAVEIAVGENISDMVVAPGSQTTAALMVLTMNNTNILYGTSSAGSNPWNLIQYNTGIGCIDYSAQNMAQTLAFDTMGAFGLQTTLAYGNFEQSYMTHNIRPFIEEKYISTSCSALNRRRNQYRLFFNDGSGLYISIVNGKWIGSMPVQFPSVMNQVIEGKLSNGQEASFGFSTDGYVYQMDIGDNFDGASMVHYLTFIYNSSRMPRILKRFMKASIEFYGTGWSSIDFGYSLGYGRSTIPQPEKKKYSNSFKQAMMDAGFTFDSGITFDSKTISPINAEMCGTAENVAITIGGDSDHIAQYTINSIIMHYQQRRILRA